MSNPKMIFLFNSKDIFLISDDTFGSYDDSFALPSRPARWHVHGLLFLPPYSHLRPSTVLDLPPFHIAPIYNEDFPTPVLLSCLVVGAPFRPEHFPGF